MPGEKKFQYVVPARFDYSCLPYSLHRYLKAVLHRDRRMYGVVPGAITAAPSDDAAAGDEPLIQRRIEDLIEAPGGSTAFQGPQNILDT